MSDHFVYSEEQRHGVYVHSERPLLEPPSSTFAVFEGLGEAKALLGRAIIAWWEGRGEPSLFEGAGHGARAERALQRMVRDLDRIPGQALAWKLAPAPPQPAHGYYSLPLSSVEHGALLRGLDALLATEQRARHYHSGVADGVRRETPLPESEDAKHFRSLRSKLLRKEKP